MYEQRRKFHKNYDAFPYFKHFRFVCDVCQRAFTMRASLRRHLNIHTAEKNFLCDLCSKSFSERGTLQLHMKIHRGIQILFIAKIINLSSQSRR